MIVLVGYLLVILLVSGLFQCRALHCIFYNRMILVVKKYILNL